MHRTAQPMNRSGLEPRAQVAGCSRYEETVNSEGSTRSTGTA
jgi:hypothetical protein